MVIAIDHDHTILYILHKTKKPQDGSGKLCPCLLLYLEPYNSVYKREVSNPQGAYTMVVMHGAIVITMFPENSSILYAFLW